MPTGIALSFGGEVGVSIDPVDELIPSIAVLNGVYPNPVQESATIGFGLTEPAHIKLAVYDLLGRKVSMLVAGIYPAGQFSVKWNPDNQVNGMYFVRMEATDRSETIPLLLYR